jgi:hypothetical protein
VAKEKMRRHELHEMIVEEAQKKIRTAWGLFRSKFTKLGPWNLIGRRTTRPFGEKASSPVRVRRHC